MYTLCVCVCLSELVCVIVDVCVILDVCVKETRGWVSVLC